MNDTEEMIEELKKEEIERSRKTIVNKEEYEIIMTCEDEE